MALTRSDVDFSFNTTWAKAAFPDLVSAQGINTTIGVTPFTIKQGSATVQKRAINSFRCPYNPSSTGTCRLDQQTITTNTITATSTKSFSAQVRARCGG